MVLNLLLLFLTVLSFTLPSYAETSWHQTDVPFRGVILSVAVDPATPQTIFAGTDDGGIFKSINGGENWNIVNTGLTSLRIRAIVVDPTNSEIIYAGTYGRGIFKSSSGGENWSAVNTGIAYSSLGNGNNLVDIYSLVIDPTNSQIIYAGTYYGVFKSINGGGSWNIVNTGTKSPSIALDPANHQIIYASKWGTGVYKSYNGGGVWSNASSGLKAYSWPSYVTSLTIDSSNSQVIYAGTANGVFKSSDGGGKWDSISNGLTDIMLNTVAIDQANNQTIYAGTDSGGVFKSSDGGNNWSPVNSGLTNTQVFTLIVDPFNPGTVYAGTAAGLFKLIYDSPPTPTSGICGSTNGTTVITIPITSLCATGAASTPTGSGPWYWTCAGTNGGTAANCNAYLGSEPATGANSTAKVYLGTKGTDDVFHAADSGVTIYGGASQDTVYIAAGISNVTLDQNVEKIVFSSTSSSYAFKQTGNKINVYDATGAMLLVSAPVQGDSDGTVLGFSNGAASALLSGGVMTLGGVTVSSTAAGAISPVMF